MRVIIGAIVGAVVIFLWGMSAWMVLGIHDGTINSFPESEQVAQYFREMPIESGAYMYPGIDEMKPGMSAEEQKAAREAMSEKHRKGPIFMIHIQKEGLEPMPPDMMGRGLAINFVAAFIASLLLWMAACKYYLQRVLFVSLFAVFATTISHVNLWNWMLAPQDYTIAFVIDVVIGWTIAGVVIAAIVKPPKLAVKPAEQTAEAKT